MRAALALWAQRHTCVAQTMREDLESVTVVPCKRLNCGAACTREHRRTPPANDASAEVDVAPVGPAMDVGVRPLRCAQRRSTKRTG